MKKEEEFAVYDEEEAVKFIQNIVPDEAKDRVDEDRINYVLDVVYDYYEANGFIEEDAAVEAAIDEEEMSDYVAKAVKKDNIDLNEDEIQLILDGEYEYGKSLGIYFDED